MYKGKTKQRDFFSLKHPRGLTSGNSRGRVIIADFSETTKRSLRSSSQSQEALD